MITIDGKEYDPESLSDEAKAQLLHLQFCDQQITAKEFELATIKTARQAYARSLADLLPGDQQS